VDEVRSMRGLAPLLPLRESGNSRMAQ
jgi:hypothetical protein